MKRNIQQKQQARNQQRLTTLGWMLGGAIALVAATIFFVNNQQNEQMAVTGKDGPAQIAAVDTVINRYVRLAGDITAGDIEIRLQGIGQLNQPQPLEKGDLLLLVQMQGAHIKVANDSSFGEVTDLGGAGNYEFAFVESVKGNRVMFGSPLRNAYTRAGKTQVIRCRNTPG